jgi:hypothetical protein
MSDLPMLIKRCLTHGIQMLPIQIDSVLSQYDLKKIPDDTLSVLPRDQLEKYVKALWYCSIEEASYWSRGHDILLELGFTKVERVEGHRCFISFVWEG